MVRKLVFGAMGIMLSAALSAASIEVSVDQYGSNTGTIMITHQPNEAIDPSSFQLDGKQITPQSAQQVPLTAGSQSEIITIYNFVLPEKAPGTYTLNPIEVKVGAKAIKSMPIRYVITAPPPPPDETEEPKPSKPAVSAYTQPIKGKELILKAGVKGPTSLFPGQRTTLFYTIVYNHSFDLTGSYLPLVHPLHFKRIGDAHINNTQEGTVSTQEIKQYVEASQPGTFSLGPSWIEGKAYAINPTGERVYDPTLVRSESAQVNLTVNPFPEDNRPGAFTGALGTITLQESLLTPPKMTVGEEAHIEVLVAGIDNPLDFKFPLLNCQPGFSGFFNMPNLFPPYQWDGKNLSYHLTVIPLTSLVDSIPPIELASFDTKNQKYITQKTSALPLTVAEVNPPTLTTEPLSLFDPVSKANFDTANWPLPALQLATLPYAGYSFGWRFFTLSLASAIMALCGLALWGQMWLKRYLKEHPLKPVPSSEVLFKQAIRQFQVNPAEALPLMSRALQSKVHERVPSADSKRIVKLLLTQFDAVRYGHEPPIDSQQLSTKIMQVWNEL